MAEAIVNHYFGDRFKAFSAGTEPTGYINPCVESALSELGIDTGGLRSKSLSQFLDESTPELDLVIAVCERGEMEQCHSWVGAEASAYWNLDRLSEASEDTRDETVWEWFALIRARVSELSTIDLESLSAKELRKAVHAAGQTIID